MFIHVVLVSTFFGFLSASSLVLPPQTALVVGFESTYDISLLANSLTDQGIDSTLIIPAGSDIYENLVEVNVIKLNFTIDETSTDEVKALTACESLLSDKKILEKIGEIQPTFVIFPALRHDGCLIPWTRFIGAIPVVWALGPSEEYYAVDKMKIALPISTESFYDRFWTAMDYKTVTVRAETNFAGPAIKLAQQYLKNFEGGSLSSLYSNVELLLWGADPILRLDFASLSHRFVEVGCHHCRAPEPLPPTLQKQLIEFRLGTVAVTLDESYHKIVETIALRLPQDRQGLAVAWKTKFAGFSSNQPKNLFLNSDVDRQDLIGYGRIRVLLSHCGDTQFLETAFHGTPVICVPRTPKEKKNAQRAVDLGFSVSLNDDYSADMIHSTVVKIHESANYRETARIVSQAIRDRPIPAADRLLFWLGYVARNDKRAIEFSPIEKGTPVKTFTEDIHLYIGMLIGTVFGALFAATSALTWYLQGRTSKSTKNKGKRHNR